MPKCSCNYSVSNIKVHAQEHKTTVNLDRDISHNEDGRLIRKVLCLFLDECGEPISLSNQTTLTFHALLEYHAGHHSHHYNFHLGKKKEDFTRRKQEEEGLLQNPFVWILDFGWTFHEDHVRNHANQVEFTYHFDKKDVTKDITMVMIAFYEDDDETDYEFGWLQNKLESIDAATAPTTVNLCKHILWS
jgi:hypothetical protein